MPNTVDLVLANQIYVDKEGLPPALKNKLIRLAAFQNPEFYKAQAMRLPTYDKPRIITCADDHSHHIALPRGCLDDVRQLLHDSNVEPVIQDERCTGERVDLGTEQLPDRVVDQTMLLEPRLALDEGFRGNDRPCVGWMAVRFTQSECACSSTSRANFARSSSEFMTESVTITRGPAI